MRSAIPFGGLLVVMLAHAVEAGVDDRPAAELARLKAGAGAAWEELERDRGPEVPKAGQEAAVERYCRQAGRLARRALALVEAHPDAPEAAEAAAWVLVGGLGAYSARLDAECDAAYDLMGERFLDEDAILPVIRIAWADAGRTARAGAFLRAAAERSANPGVKALAGFSLGRHQHQLVRLAAYLDDPIRGRAVESNLGAENVRRIRAVEPGVARREAEALYDRTLREFADLRPMGDAFPPLGEQAEGALYRLRHLEIGCTVPEVEGEDVDGRPMRLSDFRGKVVAITFWATWCGPCMGMVPDERALVARMAGRPFALVGVNGDDDRAEARAVSARERITWRSFWDGGPHGPISLRWGVSSWPTVYLVDSEGVIRNEGLRGADLDRAVEALVSEAEGSAR